MESTKNVFDVFMEEIESFCEDREAICTKEDLFQAMKLVHYLITQVRD